MRVDKLRRAHRRNNTEQFCERFKGRMSLLGRAGLVVRSSASRPDSNPYNSWANDYNRTRDLRQALEAVWKRNLHLPQLSAASNPRLGKAPANRSFGPGPPIRIRNLPKGESVGAHSESSYIEDGERRRRGLANATGSRGSGNLRLVAIRRDNTMTNTQVHRRFPSSTSLGRLLVGPPRPVSRGRYRSGAHDIAPSNALTATRSGTNKFYVPPREKACSLPKATATASLKGTMCTPLRHKSRRVKGSDYPWFTQVGDDEESETTTSNVAEAFWDWQ